MALTHFWPEDSYYHGILVATELQTNNSKPRIEMANWCSFQYSVVDIITRHVTGYYPVNTWSCCSASLWGWLLIYCLQSAYYPSYEHPFPLWPQFFTTLLWNHHRFFWPLGIYCVRFFDLVDKCSIKLHYKHKKHELRAAVKPHQEQKIGCLQWFGKKHH